MQALFNDENRGILEKPNIETWMKSPQKKLQMQSGSLKTSKKQDPMKFMQIC